MLHWVWLVLQRKGVHEATLNRLKRLYNDAITIPVVNSVQGRAIVDKRCALRQGGVGSMEWFGYGIDPLLLYLERRLKGIPIISLPVSGPVDSFSVAPLPNLEERFRVMAYCDDVKPAITCIEEFFITDTGASLFEKAAGTKLHRDPSTDKCKFLPLGKWKRKLNQIDIPLDYLKLTDTLDMVGVQLCDSWQKSRCKNGNTLQEKVANVCKSWKTGKFMPLSLRPFSANSFALSKIWFRCSTVNLRECDITAINSSIKKWLYADLFIKPEERVLTRSIHKGGLGLTSLRHKALACQIRTFLEMSVISPFLHSLFSSTLFHRHVLEEEIECPPCPPYYNEIFFSIIKSALWKGFAISTMKVKHWYNYLLLHHDNDDPGVFPPCKVEISSPETAWLSVWRSIRLPILDSDTISFAFKLTHRLLPCEARLSSILPNSSPACKFQCPGDPLSSLEHVFFGCLLSVQTGSWLLNLVSVFLPNEPMSNIVSLNIDVNDGIMWIILNSLSFIWNKRQKNKAASLNECLAMLNDKANIMIESKYASIAESIHQYIHM